MVHGCRGIQFDFTRATGGSIKWSMISTAESPVAAPVESPMKPRSLPFKDPAKASQAGKLSALARARNREKLKAALTGQQVPPPVPVVVNELQTQIDRLSKLMRALEQQMDGLTNAVTFRDLSMAHARLFESWCVLTKTPKPGVLKVGRGTRAPAPIAAFQEPQSPQTPQPVVNASDLVAPQPQAQTGTESIAP